MLTALNNLPKIIKLLTKLTTLLKILYLTKLTTLSCCDNYLKLNEFLPYDTTLRYLATEQITAKIEERRKMKTPKETYLQESIYKLNYLQNYLQSLYKFQLIYKFHIYTINLIIYNSILITYLQSNLIIQIPIYNQITKPTNYTHMKVYLCQTESLMNFLSCPDLNALPHKKKRQSTKQIYYNRSFTLVPRKHIYTRCLCKINKNWYYFKLTQDPVIESWFNYCCRQINQEKTYFDSIAARFFTKPINFKLILKPATRLTTDRKRKHGLARQQTVQDGLEIKYNLELGLTKNLKNNFDILLCPSSRAARYTQLEQGQHLQSRVKPHQSLEPQRPRRLDIVQDQHHGKACHRVSLDTTKLIRVKILTLSRCQTSIIILGTARLNKIMEKTFITITEVKKLTLLSNIHLRHQHRAELQQGLHRRRHRRRLVHHVHPLQEDNHRCLKPTAAVNPVAASPQLLSP